MIVCVIKVTIDISSELKILFILRQLPASLLLTLISYLTYKLRRVEDKLLITKEEIQINFIKSNLHEFPRKI